jgi:hypothetical protein
MSDGVTMLSDLGKLIEGYRARYRLDEAAPLVVVLGEYATAELERRGELHDDGDDKMRYVLVHGVKVRVQE